ncbi:sugar transferase [Sinanaerobacter chloroacetimidivorans]|uniref:Sugar transferase n=1 Tax=Sinanaerobacter chloroacetimidivorans TaxID=2818044 RepID=A0A8J8B2P8_9FIRM|nr:sugar transferase [Sinanaerobacter chloroacetimidivorans]MBR0599544.1 sugar transferase [Sinanaerobacter chloroacetimidivorans]
MNRYQVVKQILDFLFAVLLTIILLPLLLLITIIIKLDSKGPVLFRQKRVGQNGKKFMILKYRTMRTDTPKDMPTHLFQNAESFITRSGSILRKSSLDELPQLFNILRGEMSFIGPRPALWNQYDLLEARENQAEKSGVSANAVKPGITGWAQVNGRDELPIDVKADLDGYYAKNLSLILDIKILFMTIGSVLTSKGVSEGGPKHS